MSEIVVGGKVRVRVATRIVEVEIVKVNPLSIYVKLPDGNVIKRKIERDVVEDE